MDKIYYFNIKVGACVWVENRDGKVRNELAIEAIKKVAFGAIGGGESNRVIYPLRNVECICVCVCIQ